MNVFILDEKMTKSAAMLDDAHLKAQINEACQILMANWNHEHFPEVKVGHAFHPVTKFYADYAAKSELICYLRVLLSEYITRFGKLHQNQFWVIGFTSQVIFHERHIFKFSKTLVDRVMTDDIEAIRHYISAKPQQKKPVWTNREKPDWWEV